MDYDPGALGLNAAQLARVDIHLSRAIEKGLFPGTLLLVARRGAIAHLSVQGLADRERGTALARDTLFRLYSMTKPITSVALMTLFEGGAFQLDDPLSKFIPAFGATRVYSGGTPGNFQTVSPARPITVRDLLCHTSGLTYGFQTRTPVDAAYRALSLDDPRVPLAEWVDRLAALPLEFSPGEAWNYSVSSDVLGRLIEILSGQSLDDFLRTRLFEPLGMTDTAFFVPEEKLGRFAACYQKTPAETLVRIDDPQTSAFRKPPLFLSGGGGLVSTADDYLRFAEMLLNGGERGGARILGRKTLELMTRNHLPGGQDLPSLSRSMFSEAAYAGMGFGLGFSVMLDPALCGLPGNAGDFAWGGAANTYFWVDPKAELIVIFMTQALPSTAYVIRRELRALIYAALED